MTPEKTLLEKRAGLIHQLEDLEKNIQGRAVTDEESAKWDKIDTDISSLTSELTRNRKVKERKALLADEALENEERGGRAPADDESKGGEGGKVAYRKTFDKWLRSGYGGLSTEERGNMLTRGTAAQTTQTDSLGGFTIPEEFGGILIKAMAAYGGMLDVATVVRTTTGAAMPFPVINETGVKGRRVAENAALAVKDLTFTAATLNAYMYTSDVVLLSLQLLQDNNVNLESELTPILAERLGRILNEELTYGSGAGRPTGFLDSSASVGDTAAVAAITRGEVLDLQHGLDAAYRANARFMLNDNTMKALRKLQLGTADASPLWQPSMREGAPDLIEGKPYTINNDMPDLGAGNTPIAFGDFSKYRVRMVRDITMVEFGEKYMNQLQKGYTAFLRADGALLDTTAIKKITNAAS